MTHHELPTPRRERPHGTRKRYVTDKCHCGPCRAANTRYQTRRVRDLAYGRDRTCDATPVREHLTQLRAAGVGLRTIADRAGLNRSALSAILNGTSTTVYTATRDAVLAVDTTSARGPVDGTGTRRRLQALVAAGWPQNHLAVAMNWSPTNFTRLVTGTGKVARDTAAATRELYDARWNLDPLAVDEVSANGVARARARAARCGWPPPLAWDDDQIDDPTATPHQPGPGNHRDPDLEQHVDHLTACGWSAPRIATELGVHARTITRIRTRERPEVAA